MKITINLASQPFVELQPVYKRLRTWMVILALTGGALWFLYHSERSQADAAVARVTSVQHHVQQLESERQRYEAMMAQPKNAAILEQSDFLNHLFREKSFSWTATMEDLENVLPGGVQVLSIEPLISKTGHVTIRLRVTGARDRALDLIRNLEASQHFASPRLMAETLATVGSAPGAAMQPVSATNQVDFDILADYRPLLLPAKAAQAQQDANKGAGKPPEAKTPVKKAVPPAARHPRRPRRGVAKPFAARPAAHGGRP